MPFINTTRLVIVLIKLKPFGFLDVRNSERQVMPAAGRLVAEQSVPWRLQIQLGPETLQGNHCKQKRQHLL